MDDIGSDTEEDKEDSAAQEEAHNEMDVEKKSSEAHELDEEVLVEPEEELEEGLNPVNVQDDNNQDISEATEEGGNSKEEEPVEEEDLGGESNEGMLGNG